MKCMYQLSLVLGLVSFTGAVNATVVTFEDVDVQFETSPLYGTAALADGYAGISGWTNTGLVYGFAPQSGMSEGVGNNYFYGQSGELSFDLAPVRFQGTYYKSYSTDFNQPPIASIELFYKGNLVHTIYDPLASLGLVWVSSGYTGLVDTIRLRGGSEGFAIDNLTYETASVGQVPLPASALLFASALFGMGLNRRKL